MIGATLNNHDNKHYIDNINDNVDNIMSGLPLVLQVLFKTLRSIVVKFLLHVDDKYNIDIADQEINNSEYHSLLRAIGAEMERFRSIDVCDYFDKSEKNFVKTIWTVSDLKEIIDDIIDFLAGAHCGIINTLALKSILTSLLKKEISSERVTIHETRKEVIFSTKKQQCGVIRMEFDGFQQITNSCCTKGAETEINVKKTMIMFRDSQDLLDTLKRFANYGNQ